MKHTSLAGFTLIELLITLAVVAVLVTVGIPGFREWVQSSRVSAQTNTLVTALNMARSEAIKRRGQAAMLCKKNSGGTSCNNSGNWEDGWLLYVDADGNGAFADDGDATRCETASGTLTEDCLLKVFPAPTGITIRTANNFACWMGFQLNGNPKGSGSTCGGTGSGGDTFRLCRSGSTDVTKARFVVVGTSGRIRTESCASAASCAYTCP